MNRTMKILIGFKIAVIVLGALLITYAVVGLGYIAVLFIFNPETQVTDIEKYGETDGYGITSTLRTFPQDLENVEEVIDYHLYCAQFKGGIEVYLEAKYTEEEFCKEISRLEGVDGPFYKRKYMKKDEALLFSYTTYVATYNHSGVYEYASIDEENFTIRYVFVDYRDPEKLGIKSEYLPRNYNEVWYHQERYYAGEESICNIDPYDYNAYGNYEDIWYE